MTYNIEWDSINLRENPFPISPPDDPSLAVWANMKKLKKEFNAILKEAKGSAPTQVVLCRGPVGGGKTHASLYFSLKENWPPQRPSVKNIYVLRVPTPKETGKADRYFYMDVMEHITIKQIKNTVQQAINEVGEETARSILHKTMISADLTKALLSLGQEENSQMLEAYFLGKCSTSELRKLGLNRNIEKTQDYFRVLAGVFHCLIGLSQTREPNDHNRVCLWLDEMEDFVYFTPSQYRPFAQGLREMVDRVPFFFTIFLNFTLTSPEEYEEIELILGKYLIDRMTQQVFFDEMGEDEMLEYIRELLDIYSTSNRGSAASVKKNSYHPFTEDALRLLLSDLPRRTPRDVNIRCRNAIMKAFDEGIFSSKSKGVIDRDFIQEMTKEEIDKEIG